MIRLLALAALAAILAGGALAADTPVPAGPPTAQELFTQRRFKDAAISPSGRYIAMVLRGGARDGIAVVDLVERKTVTAFQKPDMDYVWVDWLAWKGDDRLVLSYSGIVVAKNADGSPKTRTISGKDGYGRATDIDGGIVSISRFGQDLVDLEWGRLVDALPDDADSILISRRPDLGRNSGDRVLERVNVRTGARTRVDRGSERTIDWAVDRTGKPVVRYDVFGRRGGLRVYGRDAADRWQELFSIRERDLLTLPDLEILGPSSEPGKLYVAVRPEDRANGDTRELRTYDFVARTMGPRIWSHPRYDLDGILFEGPDRKLAAMCYWADVYACDYIDPGRRREFEALAGFFDGERSITIISTSRDNGVQLLSVTGPDEAGSLYVYDRSTRKIDLLGSRYPKLHPDRLGIMGRYAYAARDGYALSGYLTEPPNRPTGPLPLIVMPHGGPEARDHFDYNRWVQAFASRGYLVLQPNFRGSGGMGAGFAELGYRQWGLRMQDDVMDGVRSLIASGRVDPARICIVGASYGGYVALYAGAREPDLFKCVVSVAGVSDLVAIQKWERAEAGADSLRYAYWLKSIGDPVADRQQLIATSPITYAAAYRPPVLLIHGDHDDIVDVGQSRAMQAALKRAGKDSRLIILPGEGHSGWAAAAEITTLTEMLAFVEKAIGPRGP